MTKHRFNVRNEVIAKNISEIVTRLNNLETTVGEEAKRYNVHTATISGWRRKVMGENWFSLRHRSKLDNDKDLIMGLHEAGIPPDEIAFKLDEEYEVSGGTVRNFINKHKPKIEPSSGGLLHTTMSELHNCCVPLSGETLLLKRRQKMNYVLIPESEYMKLVD